MLVRAIGVALGILLALAGLAVHAQPYPARPVRIIVPYPPGGPTDIIARHIAKRLSDGLGQQFLVDNRPGANGVIGTGAVAKASPDGYTLLLNPSGPLASGLALYKNVSYDAARDFTPITIIAKSSIVLVSGNRFPAATLPELLKIAKAKPEGVSAEVNTVGSIHHLLTELLRVRTGAKLLLVPYKGSGPAIVDLVAGHVDIGFESVPGVIGFIRDGKLKAYAIADEKRLEALPNVPTFSELGMPEFVAEPWWAILGPAGMPREVSEKLSAALRTIVETPEVKSEFAAQGMTPNWGPPDEAARFLQREVSRWAAVVKETGAQGQ